MDVSNFTAYERITIDHTKVYGSSNHSNFPILVDITITALKHTSNGGYVDSTSGDDIVFIDYDGTTQLDHEIQSYNSETGNIIAWVRIPTLDTTADTEIFIYFGDSNITTPQENPSGTWIENFVLIHHMDDVSGTITDSLGSHNSNSQTGMTYQQTGKINKSIYFDEVDDHYTISDFNYGDTFTISLWFKEPDAVGSLLQYIFSHGVTGNNPSTFIRTMESGHTYANRLYASAYDDVSSIEEVYSLAEEINVNDGNWHLFQFIRVKNGTTKLVVDGGLRDSYSSPNTSVSPSTPIYIGGRQDLDVDRFFGGYLEELHIASVERTVEWCATEYANQNSPSTFYTISGNYMSSTSSTTSSSTASLNVDSVGKIINLVVDHTKVFGTGDHSNFPALVSITRDYLRSVSQGGEVYYDNGTDIVFLSDPDDSTSYLDFEIQQYDCTTGLLIAWVRVPSLDTTANTTIYLSFGDSSISTSQENINGVWISNFEGVWHLKESGNGTSNEFIDSSGGNKHGTGGNGSASATPTRTEGKIGYCQSFDGNDFITMGDVFDYGKSTQHSYSAWVRTSNSSAMQIIGKASHSTWQGIWCDFEAGGDLSFFIYDSGGNYKSKTCNTNFTDNNWHYIMTTYNGNNDVSGINIYADGSLITPASSNNDNLTGAVVNDFPFNVGAANNSGYFWNGLISEPRFRHYETTLEWYQTEYANQNSPSTFYTFEIPLYCTQEITTSTSATLTLGVVESLDSTCSITTSVSSTIILGLVEVLSTTNIVVSDTTSELILGADEDLASGCYALSDSTAELTLGIIESLSSSINIYSDSTSSSLILGASEALSSTCDIASDSTASTLLFGQYEPLSSTSNSTTSVDSALILGLVEVLSTTNIVVSVTTSELILGADEDLASTCNVISNIPNSILEADYITAHPWQRKIWYDGTRIWKAIYSESLKAIIFLYSTQTRLSIDPNDWTENTNARITNSNVSSDFAIRGGISALHVVYSDYEDIYGRRAAGYPATNFSWNTPVLIFDGSSSGGRFHYPDIAKGGTEYRVNVSATLRETVSGNYSLRIKQGASTNAFPTSSTASKILVTAQSSPIISSIRNGVNTVTGTLICVWRRGVYIESAYRNGPDNNPVGGDDWGSTQSIATGKSGIDQAFAIASSSGTSKTVLIYINSSGNVCYRDRSEGVGQSWSSEVILDVNIGCKYPDIGQLVQYEFHCVWLDSSNVIRHRVYNISLNTWDPTISPYIAADNLGAISNLSWLNISTSGTPSSVLIYQQGYNNYTLLVEPNNTPLDPTNLKCENQTNPTIVFDQTPEFTAVYNSNGDIDQAIKYQLEARHEERSFVSSYEISNLDSTAGISTLVSGLQTGTIILWSLNGTVGESPASYLGTLVNNVYTDGNTLDTSKPVYLVIKDGASCSAGDTLTIKLQSGSTLTVYLPQIIAGDIIYLFITDLGSTWYDSIFTDLAAPNPIKIGLNNSSYFVTPVSDGTACEEINFTNNFPIEGDKYYWKIRMMDNGNRWSLWSTEEAYFIMISSLDSTCYITTDSTAELTLGTSEPLSSTSNIFSDATAEITLGFETSLYSTCNVYSDSTAEITLGFETSLSSSINIYSDATAIIEGDYITAYPWQTKIVYDDTYIWKATYDETLKAIIFEYSTSERLSIDPNDWTENINARITDADVSADFSIHADNTYLFITYSTYEDIYCREATGYPGTNFSWDNPVLTYDGSVGGGRYSFPNITRDGANYRVNVISTLYKTGTQQYSLNIKIGTATNRLPGTSQANKILITDQSLPIISAIRRGPNSTTGSIIAVWKRGTNIESAYRNGTDNNPVGGDDWETTQSIATGLTGTNRAFDITINSLTGYTELVYIKSSGYICHRSRPAGSGQSWSNEEALCAFSHNYYPVIGEHQQNGFHVLWYDYDTNQVQHREYNSALNEWYPSIDPLETPELKTTVDNLSWLNISSNTGSVIAIYQVGFNDYTLYIKDNEIPLAPTDLRCEGQINPVDVHDTTPEFTAIYNSNGDDDLAYAYQIELRREGELFTYPLMASGLDSTAGIETSVTGLQTGLIELWSINGTVGGSQASYLGKLENGVYTDGDTLDSSSSLYLSLNNGAYCSYGDTLTLNFEDGSSLSIYLPTINAGEHIILFLTNDGTTWKCSSYCIIGCVNPDSIGLMSGSLFDTPISDGTACEEVNLINELDLDGTTYYWKIRFRDESYAWSPWSDSTSYFTMHVGFDSTCNITTDSTAELSLGTSEILLSTCEVYTDSTSFTIALQIDSTSHCYIISNSTAGLTLGEIVYLSSTCDIYSDATAELTLGTIESLDSTCNITTSTTSVIILGLVEVLSSVNVIVSDTTCELIIGTDETLNSGCYIDSTCFAELTLGTETTLSSICNITSDSTATTLTLGRIEQLSVINCYIYSDTTSELTLGTSESLSSTCIITTDSTSFTIALEIDSTSCCTIASSSVAGELVLGLVEVLSTDNIVVSDCTCELILGTDEQLDSTCNISTYVEANLFLGIPLTSTSTITTDSTAEITLGRSESLFGSSDSETNMYGWLYFGVGEDLRGDSQALSSASALLTLGVTEEISSTCSIINSSSSTLVLGLSEVLTSTCNITTDSTASLSFTGELIDLTSYIDIYSDSTAIFTLDNLSISGSTNVLSDATAIITLGELTSLSSTININSDTTAILYNAIELDSTATIQSIVSSRMEVNVILISSHFCDSTSEVNAELSVIKSISSTANISSSLSGYIVFGTFELLSSDSHTYSNVGPSPLLIGYIVLSSISYVTSDSTAELTIGTSESLSSSSDITSDSTALLYISGSPISLDSTSYIDSTSIASLVITRGLDSTAIIVSDSTATTFILNPLAIDSTSITTSDVTGEFSNIVALDSTSSVMSDSTSDLTSGAGEGITGTSSTTSDTTGVINLIPLALNGTPGVNSNVQAVISLVTSVSGTTSLITSTLAKLYIGNIENIDSTCIIVTNSIAELTLGTIESLSSTCFIDSTAYSETLTISGSELGLDSTCIISTTVLASLSTGEFVSLDSTCIIDTTSYSTITLGKTELISLTCYVYSDAAAELTIGTSESLSGSSDSTSYVISELTIGGYTESLDSTCNIVTDISGTLTLGDIVSLSSTCDVSTDATCELSFGTSESLSSTISVDSTCYASLTIGIHSTCNITTDSTANLTFGTIENLEATTNLISIAVAGTLILGIPVDLHSTSYIISDATCELSFGTQEYLNSSVNVTSDSTSYLTLGTIEELFGQSNITSDSTASILNVGTIEELTSTSNIDSTCIATISLGQLEYIYSTIIIDSTATASITMGAITELSSNVVIQSDSTSSTLITGQPESLTSLINIDSTCYAELTLGTIESLSSSISYTSNTSTPSLVFGIIEVLSSTSYSIVDGTCILAVEMVIDSTCDILSSVISELTIGHIESISSTCNITSDSTAELTLGTITQLTSTCSITSNINGSIYIGEITTLDSTCIIVSNVACGRYFNVYKSKEFKSKIATLEVEFWFGQFIVNREANITPVDFTEVTFVVGENTGEKSFIEMLFNDDYSYTNYRYLYRELTDDREWPEAMRTRLNIYGKYNSYYVCDNDSSSVCNINLYNVTSGDREMLDRLLTYRVDPTTANLNGINYDDLQSPLSCLIYLYLDLKINSSLQYYQEGILLSTSGYNLESFYEKYVLEEIFRFISSR